MVISGIAVSFMDVAFLMELKVFRVYTINLICLVPVVKRRLPIMKSLPYKLEIDEPSFAADRLVMKLSRRPEYKSTTYFNFLHKLFQ